MCAQVVQDQMDPMGSGVARSKALPSLPEIVGGFPFMDDSFHNISMNVVESQKLFCPSSPGICCPMALRVSLSSPRDTGHGSQFHGPELVKANNMALSGSAVVEFQNAVFFTSKSGSGDSFQVFVR
jgi:hypothetical protein